MAVSSSEEVQICSEAEEDRDTGEFLDIRFQKNPNYKLKYLEAEPKILGVTQITLSVFSAFAVLALEVGDVGSFPDSLGAVTNIFTVVAGSLAIAAQNLHLPTLKACLGMQVMACFVCVISSIININTLISRYYCWESLDSEQKAICKHVNIGIANHVALQKLFLAIQVALSGTLAAYCCKVIQCCSPVSSVPVITVSRPQDSQSEPTQE